MLFCTYNTCYTYFSVPYDYFGIYLEYVIVKIWRRKASEDVHASNKMESQMNVATDNPYIYSYSFNI